MCRTEGGAKRRDDERAARLGLGGRERHNASDWPASLRQAEIDVAGVTWCSRALIRSG